MRHQQPGFGRAAYALTCKTVGIPSILVTSAGIAGPNASMESYGIDDWHRVIDINLNGLSM